MHSSSVDYKTLPQDLNWRINFEELVMEMEVGAGGEEAILQICVVFVREDFVTVAILLNSEFGQVWKATWRSNAVAVKKMNRLLFNNEAALNNFKYEVSLMKTLRPSANVVLLRKWQQTKMNETASYGLRFLQQNTVGVCEEPLCVVTEFCARGSLLSYLHLEDQIPDSVINNIIFGIAKGMLHLVRVSFRSF